MDYLIFLNKWPDFVVTVFGVIFGAFVSFILIKWQSKRDLNTRKSAYITNLLMEFKHNREIMYKIKSFVGEGPDIDNLWSPAEVNAISLITEAWNELIKSGILPMIDIKDRTLLQITNRTVHDVKRKIQEISANWKRVEEWHKIDIQKGNQLLTQRMLYKDKALREATEYIDYSINSLDEAINILKVYCEDK